MSVNLRGKTVFPFIFGFLIGWRNICKICRDPATPLHIVSSFNQETMIARHRLRAYWCLRATYV